MTSVRTTLFGRTATAAIRRQVCTMLANVYLKRWTPRTRAGVRGCTTSQITASLRSMGLSIRAFARWLWMCERLTETLRACSGKGLTISCSRGMDAKPPPHFCSSAKPRHHLVPSVYNVLNLGSNSLTNRPLTTNCKTPPLLYWCFGSPPYNPMGTTSTKSFPLYTSTCRLPCLSTCPRVAESTGNEYPIG